MSTNPFGGADSGVEPVLTRLAPGVWVTCGRAVVLEGTDHLAVIDPGDEPGGPLADVRTLLRETGKPLRWLLVTHAHPDHIANLAAFRELGPATVVAHPAGPLSPGLAVSEPTTLDAGGGLEVLPTPGHSARGDDLTFWLPSQRIVFPGDVVQPKGEVWERTFFPSPWVFFLDGDLYTESLRRIAALPFDTLVTGHREIRRGDDARRWVELTARSLQRVAEAAASWTGVDDVRAAGPALYREIARERGLPEEVIEARLAPRPGGLSAFESYDLPGLAYYWKRRKEPKPLRLPEARESRRAR